ncbi:MAG: electron transport complex subunit RsxC [Clostridiales bacterium]|jgi:electron transport complex protein RnfC|nr:electron transport complex subunit RsxC [Clostridiales bacterium]
MALLDVFRLHTFIGGVHPHTEKERTNSKPIEVILPKLGAELIYPCSQHIGAPCEPLAAPGDRVLAGQKIAGSDAFVSAPVHASVSGVVKEIRDILTPSGTRCKGIVVENDGKHEQWPDLKPNPDFRSFSKEQIIGLIKEAGIVGMGGAGFPTHIKLNPPPDKKIEYCIVNAAECEPYLTNDHRLLLEETDRLITGLRIILSLHPGSKGIIGIETNKMDAIDILKKKCRDFPDITVMELMPKYPQGSEKQLIYACTGREVRSGTLPADSGCVVNNVDTVVAVERAVVRGRPLMRRVVTVTGGAVKRPGNYKVRLGMTYRDLMDAIDGFAEEPVKMISGGPMMGVSMFTLDVPIVKTSSAFLCFTEEEAVIPPERNCIRCGKCVSQCPMYLMPYMLNQSVIRGDLDAFCADGGLECMECGTCSYSCPAKRHLAQSIRAAKREVLAKRKK